MLIKYFRGGTFDVLDKSDMCNDKKGIFFTRHLGVHIDWDRAVNDNDLYFISASDVDDMANAVRRFNEDNDVDIFTPRLMLLCNYKRFEFRIRGLWYHLALPQYPDDHSLRDATGIIQEITGISLRHSRDLSRDVNDILSTERLRPIVEVASNQRYEVYDYDLIRAIVAFRRANTIIPHYVKAAVAEAADWCVADFKFWPPYYRDYWKKIFQRRNHWQSETENPKWRALRRLLPELRRATKKASPEVCKSAERASELAATLHK